MIKMKFFGPLAFPCFLLVSSLVFGVISHLNVDNGEYGHYHKWRKTLCEKKNQTLFDDVDACFQKESKTIKDATEDCINDVMPEAKGKVNKFEEAACKNISMFLKFDQCFDEYEANPSFKKQVNLSIEAKDCYKKIVMKHNLPELLFYFA